jgi:tRNA threonylcarbamoyladenosine biosynthesis protein TsaE
MELTLISRSGRQTFGIGEQLGKLLDQGMVIALKGELGAGKTTFVKGLARGLGVPDTFYVTSPTYTIMNEYPARLDLCHMDLYRLGTSDELDYIGFYEMITQDRVIVIEWPEIIEPGTVDFDLSITISQDRETNRKISFTAYGLEASKVLSNLFM